MDFREFQMEKLIKFGTSIHYKRIKNRYKGGEEEWMFRK